MNNKTRGSRVKGGFRLVALVAASLLIRCQECPAEVLGTNQSSGDVTLTNMTWRVALTNATGNVPLVTTFYNMGDAGIEYSWRNTNSAHYLPPWAIVSFGPATVIFDTLYWRAASNNVSAVGRVRRDYQRQ
jgi:hypothetical protein